MEIFKDLSVSKSARLIDNLSLEDNIQKFLISKLAETNFNKTVDIFMALKDSRYGVTVLGGVFEGSSANSTLNSLDKPLKKKILEEIKKRDKQYHDNILATSQQVKAWGTGDTFQGQKVWTTDIPKASRNKVRSTISDSEKAVEVMQHQYLITNAKSNELIQTFGAGPCVIVTLYDKNSKTGLMTHLDATTPVDISFDRMISEFAFRGLNPQNLEARIIGGQEGSSEKLVYEIEKRLGTEKIKVVERDYLNNIAGSDCVTMNLNTGEVFDYDETIHSTKSEELDALVKKITTYPRNVVYRHKGSLKSVGVIEHQDNYDPNSSKFDSSLDGGLLIEPFNRGRFLDLDRKNWEEDIKQEKEN